MDFLDNSYHDLRGRAASVGLAAHRAGDRDIPAAALRTTMSRLSTASIQASADLDLHPRCVADLYFVYVSLGWNLWVSVSDWEAGKLEASYGFGGFGNYVKMLPAPTLACAQDTLLLFCLIPLCLLLGAGAGAELWIRACGYAGFSPHVILLRSPSPSFGTGTVWAYMYRPTAACSTPSSRCGGERPAP